MKGLRAPHDEWSSITLVDVSGKLLFDTTQPLGAEPFGGAPEHATLQALQTGKPAVSELVSNLVDPNDRTLAIAPPVFEDAPIQYAICVRYRAVALSKVFGGLYVPPRWIMAVFDREGALIASSRNAAARVGQRGPPETIRAAAGPDQFLSGSPPRAASRRLPSRAGSRARVGRRSLGPRRKSIGRRSGTPPQHGAGHGHRRA